MAMTIHKPRLQNTLPCVQALLSHMHQQQAIGKIYANILEHRETNSMLSLLNKQCFAMLLSCKHTNDNTQCNAELCVSHLTFVLTLMLDLQSSHFVEISLYNRVLHCTRTPFSL